MHGTSLETFTVLSGGTIFDIPLFPLIQYIRSGIMTVFVAVAIYAIMQMMFDITMLIGGIVFQQGSLCIKTIALFVFAVPQHEAILYGL
ncbi:hypothetical protein EDD17DRAFT_1760935 [Pisolithus thermaeus]|nr:hypothetical protein EV401DRAFT_2080403 [Pisolithus croceorrhizus]KAI6160422.1 hypothetical protein EDD17DRAFT_1760935 [Pisolithus thermaeus]